MMVNPNKVRDVESDYVLQVYKRLPVVFVRGKVASLYDAGGKDYIDLLSGLGVALGVAGLPPPSTAATTCASRGVVGIA